MAVSADLVALLIAKGITGDDLVEVLRAAEGPKPVERVRSAGAERTARYRANLKGEVTESDVTVTRDSDVTSDVTAPLKERSPTPPKENNPHTSLRSEIPRARSELFVEFWTQAYPKRTGSNPKQPAEEKFCRLLKAVDDPEALGQAIIAGARAYAASVAGDDPRFVAQAVTWLNQGRWRDDHQPANQRPAPSQRAGPANRPAKPSAVAAWTEDIFTDEQRHNASAQTRRPALAYRG